MSKVPPPKTSVRTQPYDTGRVDFAGHQHFLDVGDLVGHQTESFRWFVEEGLPELFAEMGPIEEEVIHNKPGGGQQHRERFKLEFKKLEFAKLQRTDFEARRDKLTYEALLRADVKLTRSSSGVGQTATVYMGNYPWMTNRGTFVLNGSERIIISQISRSPGVLFSITSFSRGRCHYGAKIAPSRGAWLEIATLKDGDLSVKIDRRRRVSLTSFLVALGIRPEQIRQAVAEVDTGPINYIEQTFAKDGNFTRDFEQYANAARLEVYSRLRPGDSINVKNALEVLENRFFNPRQYDLSPAGRHKLNQRLGLVDPPTPDHPDGRVLQLDDLLAVVVEIIRLNNSNDPPDDIDSLGNRRIRMVGELIRNQFRVGMLRMERNIRERMQTSEPESVSAGSLINARPIIGSVRTFFASSQLSQYMDQVNPLSELAHKRRLSSMGPGGLNRDRAGPQVRDVHPTHYGRICPVETPEGPTIGLVLNMALYAKINRYGFLQTPYRIVNRALPAKQLAGHQARGDLTSAAGKVIVAGGQLISAEAAKQLARRPARPDLSGQTPRVGPDCLSDLRRGAPDLYFQPSERSHSRGLLCPRLRSGPPRPGDRPVFGNRREPHRCQPAADYRLVSRVDTIRREELRRPVIVRGQPIATGSPPDQSPAANCRYRPSRKLSLATPAKWFMLRRTAR